MSRNWPIVTSRRIVAYSARADAASSGGCRGQPLFEKIVAPRHEQVAEQDRARPAERRGIAGPSVRAVRRLERAVRGGAAAAGVGVVDHVVVHERGGVEDLERGRGRDDRPGAAPARPDASSTALHPAMQNRPRSRLPPADRGRSGLDEKLPLRARDRPSAARWAERKMSRRWETASTASGEGDTGLA